ncbi:glycosyl hydrolases family 31-domain-containing protein [Immersiella caudata]|uniref:alpha-glucosidase n=1 Tax=Immersiella caudata TaxID=314043 RepID=A0AA39WB02_9PEZI|nr:glycosyl hydrolases family 31-domain-containing protein [Immersiella caudata]
MAVLWLSAVLLVLGTVPLVLSANSSDPDRYGCPGYEVDGEVTASRNSLNANLKLAGDACNIHGTDISRLKLTVEYQTDLRLHVKIEDADSQVYQIQDQVLPRPPSASITTTDTAWLNFTYTTKPFTFKVTRAATGEVLFNTAGSPLIFESQYVHLRTSLPRNVNLYGLGEHSDSFRLPDSNYKRTMWNSESPFIPQNSNLYGTHPVYYDHRTTGTHGVFLLNANGMDIDLGRTDTGRYLEYNTIGGILDFYFFTGPDPATVSEQYALTVGLPAMMPYWALGFHQCKYGWKDLDHVKEVVANYSAAGIPLETMWGDIDYMDKRRDFTPDPARFPLDRYKDFINSLHRNNQHYVMILDPGIANDPSYPTFSRGAQKGAFLRADDGFFYRGRQWAGEVVWPDWFAPDTQTWWTDEIQLTFDPSHGLPVDGLWVDMDEASNMCDNTLCFGEKPTLTSAPTPTPPKNHRRNYPQAPKFHQGLPNRNLFTPSYHIANHAKDHSLSGGTLYTNITNADGTTQYDTHNLYGHLTALATRTALLTLHPRLRPFILTRSTFSGTGSLATHWFGDNASTWPHLRASITQMLSFTALHAMPMVGSDVCGFNLAAKEHLCTRWAMVGAFQPFYRNHADITAPDQEFYRWELVTRAAKRAIETRYRLLDYVYTALYKASETGRPIASPLWFAWPGDEATYAVERQWLWGEYLLVSPVVEEGSMQVEMYLPEDVFYDFWTGERVQGGGKVVVMVDVGWDEIPVHVRGGGIVPMRVRGGMTTEEVRRENFEILVAEGLNGTAKGELYLDDGVSLEAGRNKSVIEFSWDGEWFVMNGTFGFETTVVVERVKVTGVNGTRVEEGSWGLNAGFKVQI